MKLHRFALIVCLLLPGALAARGEETKAEQLATRYAQREIAAAPLHGNLPDYALPPEALAKAQHLGALRTGLHFGGEVWGSLTLVLLLALGGVAWMRDRAVAFSRHRWVQAYAFLLLFLITRTLLFLPLSVYGHRLSLQYGLSVQRWQGWFIDLGKGLAIEWLLGGALLVLLFAIVRAAPRRWWLLFWLVLLPIMLAGVSLAPLVFDPLFNTFEPLAHAHPELSAQLERMGVPASRQFLMKASAKVTTPNAYVTGLGISKRIVVWDTSLTPGQLPDPQVLWMVGHECGHYVLHHVLEGTLLTLAAFLPLLYVLFRSLQWCVARFGARWRIPSQADWGAVAILLLAYSLFAAMGEPISNTVSRSMEHQADIYGEEAIHGLVADPQNAVQQANQTDGLRTFDDPNPNPFVEFWSYTHPATGRRAAFGKAYNPWAAGMEPKYFKRRQ